MTLLSENKRKNKREHVDTRHEYKIERKKQEANSTKGQITEKRRVIVEKKKREEIVNKEKTKQK